MRNLFFEHSYPFLSNVFGMHTIRTSVALAIRLALIARLFLVWASANAAFARYNAVLATFID